MGWSDYVHMLVCIAPKTSVSSFMGYFDYYVSSAAAGYRKPDCKGLQMISERFSFLNTERIFIGDEEKDRKTAINAHCKFICLQRTERNEESIGNLNELLQVTIGIWRGEK